LPTGFSISLTLYIARVLSFALLNLPNLELTLTENRRSNVVVDVIAALALAER
jgi:hypothetical protein